MANNAPVVVYTYTRLAHLKRTVAALRANHLASKTDIFIVSDGPKNEEAKSSVRDLRNYVDSIDGFNSVNRIYREKNIGIFQSVLQAEQPLISDYGRLITIEDDIVTSANFLDFINAGLDYHEASDNIYTISGYCHPIEISTNHEFDSWKCPWFCPWGYGIWKKKYDQIDLHKNPIYEISSNKDLFKILKESGDFFIDTLYSDVLGGISATDARICGQMLQKNLHTVMPTKSKVLNIGCDGSGVNSGIADRFDVALDEGVQRSFVFSDAEYDINNDIVQRYLKFMNGGFLKKTHRQILRSLRQYEILRNIKNKLTQ